MEIDKGKIGDVGTQVLAICFKNKMSIAEIAVMLDTMIDSIRMYVAMSNLFDDDMMDALLDKIKDENPDIVEQVEKYVKEV